MSEEETLPKGTLTLFEFLEWCGSGTGLMGALAISLNVTPMLNWIGFLFFLASNGFWLWTGYMRRSFPMITVQLGFTFTSVLGILQWFPK
jgi:hypothetical protein